MDWRHGSSNRMPVVTVCSEFNFSPIKKKKKAYTYIHTQALPILFPNIFFSAALITNGLSIYFICLFDFYLFPSLLILKKKLL
jgi:hypothetical protein